MDDETYDSQAELEREQECEEAVVFDWRGNVNPVSDFQEPGASMFADEEEDEVQATLQEQLAESDQEDLQEVIPTVVSQAAVRRTVSRRAAKPAGTVPSRLAWTYAQSKALLEAYVCLAEQNSLAGKALKAKLYQLWAERLRVHAAALGAKVRG
jgi:hypothetical protein